MMQKTLYIIRHAKAKDFSFVVRDFDRQLVDKGKIRATNIASQILYDLPKEGKIQLLTSSAARAIETANIFAHTLGYKQEAIVQTASIYEAKHLDILQEINKIPDDIDTLLVFGHNPGLSQLIAFLTDEYIYLKTSSVAKIKLEEGFHFSELTAGIATLTNVFTDNNS